jgi:hypothetical protein
MRKSGSFPLDLDISIYNKTYTAKTKEAISMRWIGESRLKDIEKKFP